MDISLNNGNSELANFIKNPVLSKNVLVTENSYQGNYFKNYKIKKNLAPPILSRRGTSKIFVSKPLKEGYLEILKHKEWKKHWFELRDSILFELDKPVNF